MFEQQMNNSYIIQYNTVKPNLKGSPVLLRFRDSSKDKEKKKSGLEISFGSSNRFGLNVFDLTVLYCIIDLRQFVIKTC